MAARSTDTRYGWVAIAIHWLTALAILVLLASGTASTGLEGADKLGPLSFHVPLGILVLVLTLARILWWWLADTKPAAVEGLPRWQAAAGRAVHIGFYLVILAMAGSGIALIAISGASDAIRSGVGELPDFWDFPPRVAHMIGARLMLALLVLHIGAALYHHFIRRDATFRRMLGRG